MTAPRTPLLDDALSLSRRRFLVGAAAVTGAAASGAAASGLVVPAFAGSGLSTVTPRMADSLLDSFGVVIHPSWSDTAYADHEALLGWLTRLKIRHVRTRLTLQKPVLDLFEKLAKHGIKVNAVCGALGDPQSMDDLMRTVATRFANPAQVFSAFEGINEPNNDGVAWVAETRSKSQALFEARKRHGLTAIPILAPALARVNAGGVEGENTAEQAQNLGDLSAWVDGGTMHVYPRALPPSSDIDYFSDFARQVAGPKPITVTEGGYFTATDYVGGARRVSPGVAAAYGPQKILEHLRAGNTRYFRYEFLEKPTGRSWDRLATFGLLRTDSSSWKPKPEFGATRRLLAKFADPGDAFIAAPLTYNISGGPAALKHEVFAKRDGSHLLALWLDRRIWDPETGRLTVGSLKERQARVTLNLSRAREGVVTHVVDPRGRRHFSRTTSTTIGLTTGVTVVKLLP